MRWLARLTLLAIVPWAGCKMTAPEKPAATPTAKKIAGPFDGVWIGRVAEDDGVWTMLVERERLFITRTGSSNWLKGTLQLRRQGNLHAVDLTVTDCDCDLKGKIFAALARRTGDRLEIASAKPGAPRPVQMDLPGLRRIRLLLAREKPPTTPAEKLLEGGTFTVTIGPSSTAGPAESTGSSP